MATSMRSLVLLCLVVAAFVAEAHGSSAPVEALVREVRLKLNLVKCPSLVNLYVGAGKAVACKGGAVTVVGPVKVHLDVPYLLNVKLEIVVSASVKLGLKVKLDLLKLGKVVGGVFHVVLDVVEDKKHKKVDLLCLGKVLKSLDLDDILELGL